MIEVVDKAIRVDGKEVFKFIESYQFPDGVYRANTNYFVEDGFYWRTELDTITGENSYQNNPFHQQKLAMVWPVDGERFQINDGANEENRLYMQITMMDEFETSIELFTNIARYTQYNNNGDTHLSSFYANKYGQIGTYYSNGIDTAKVQLSYIRANNIEEGNFVQLSTNNFDIKTFDSKRVLPKSIFSYLKNRSVSGSE